MDGLSGRRILLALGVLGIVGVVGGYGIALRGRPEPVRIPLQTSAPATERRAIYVHVAGAVERPGLYELRDGDRVDAAVRAAGGARPDADLDGVNLASKLRDGDKVVVPARGAAEDGDAASDGKVDLNRASEADLQTLPGIGPALAERIIAYREQHGGFRTVEDLLKVSGIGPRKFEQLADLVTV